MVIARTETSALQYSCGITDQRIAQKEDAVNRVSNEIDVRLVNKLNAVQSVTKIAFMNMIPFSGSFAERYCIREQDIIRGM
jgi:ribonucleotide reductase beta subunit family protein with ferritin-like domain